MSVISEIAAERERQQSAEGWTPAHDDTHTDKSLARAACCYARLASLPDATYQRMIPLWNQGDPKAKHPQDWPWEASWLKPTTPRRDLIKAAALIVAEIERLDRAEQAVAQ